MPIVCFSLAACSPLLDKADSEVLPEVEFKQQAAWSESQQAPALLGWESFVSSEQLDALIAEANQNNLDLAASAARVQAARELARSASGRRWPTLDLGLDGNRQQRASTAFTTAGSTITETVTGSLSASWELDLWGGVALQAKAAGNTAQQQQELLYWSRFSLAGQLARVWLDTIEARQQWLLAQQREKNLADNLETIESGFRSGIRDALDVYSARAEAASSEVSSIARQQTYQTLVRQLEVLLGRYPAAQLEQLPERAPQLNTGLPETIGLELLQRRPDVRASAHALISQQANVGVATANRLPRLTLRGSYGASNDSLHDVLAGDDVFWSAVAGLAAPLFRGGQLAAEQRRQKALLEASAADYRKTVLNAVQEVEQRMDNERLFSAQLDQARRANEISRLAEQQAFESYLSGLSNLNTWLQAQRTAFDRQSFLVQLENSLLKNRIDLYLALGGDFGLAGSETAQSGS